MQKDIQQKASRLSCLRAFVLADHRYVFLASSAFGALGLWISFFARSEASFLARIPNLILVFRALLVLWLFVSLLALFTKLVLRATYAQRAIFCRPGALKPVRYASYLIWAVSALLLFDFLLAGFLSALHVAMAARSVPQGFLPGALYMIGAAHQIFLIGLLNTIGLALFGTSIAFVLALLLVFLRIQKPDRSDNDFIRFLKVSGAGFARLYSTLLRATPLLIQGLLIYGTGFVIVKSFGLTTSEVGTIWSPFVAGLVTISLNSGAYILEVLRGGIESVDAGQMEAARSLGLSQWQAMRKVIFPQGIKNSIPALSNELILNIKDSSVLSVAGVYDFMFAATSVAGIYFRQLDVYWIAAFGYLVLTLAASWLLTKVSRHFGLASPQMIGSN